MSNFERRHRFIDGVGEIRIHDDIVRLDLLAKSPTGRGDDGEVMPEFAGQLVMSPTGFMRLVKVLGMTLAEMEEQNIQLAKSEGAQAIDTPLTPRKTARISPNFM